MGRRRTGTFFANEGTWPDGSARHRGRLRLGDGSKSERFDLPMGLNEKLARAYLASLQTQEDTHGGLLEQKRAGERERARKQGTACDAETADAWHARFLFSRVGDVGNVKDSRGRWRKWVSQHIGPKPMTLITRDDIETVRDGLDAAVAAFKEKGRGEGRLMPKSAQNIWAVVTTAFKYACQAKRATALRVRDDNPCTNVLPPTNGDSRRKTWIYPSEFLQLVTCEAVPREWRELYAVACYLYLRPGELYELRWRDVDLDSEVVCVTRAWDWEERVVKTPKTSNGVREIPIPPALMPLLTRLREGRGHEDKVVPIIEVAGENKGATFLRTHLALAKVSHPRLIEDSSTRMPVGFRSWRDTGITWAAIDGVDVHKLQRRAGHDDINTTLGYVKEAEDRDKLRGKAFPTLPNELVWTSDWTNRSASTRETRASVVPEEGVESSETAHIDVRSRASGDDAETTPADPTSKGDDEDAFGPAIGPTADGVDAALTRALDAASTAGRFDVVAQLVRELEARRLVRAPNVVTLRRREGR